MSGSCIVVSWIGRMGQFILRVASGALMVSLVSIAIVCPSAVEAATESSTVAVGAWPRYIGINPSTGKVYVVNNFDGTVSAINGETLGVIATVTVGGNPSAIAVNPATNKIYVANVESQGYGTVSVIDGSTDTVTATVTVGFSPKSLAVNQVTNKVYVANSFSNSVTVIDAGDNYSTSTINVGSFPVAVAVDVASNKVFVANSDVNGTVTAINAADNNSTETIDVGAYPIALAVNNITKMVYVVNSSSNGSITVINPADNNSTLSVSVGSYPFALAIDHTNNNIYVLNQGYGAAVSTVSIIEGATHTVSGIPIPVGRLSYDIQVNQVTNKIYVADRGSDSVTMIDGITLTPTTLTAPSGQVWDAPRAIAVMQENNKIFVANEISGNITVLQNFYGISVVRVGDGGGTVTSYPGGINCGSSCTAAFPEGQAVVLFQTPEANSGFSGWGGSCAGTGDCAFSLLSDKTVSADFTLSPQVKNQTTGVAYSSMQAACDEAKDRNTISARTTLSPARLNLTAVINLNLEGGYDAEYSACIGLTTILGRLDVRLAPVRVRGLAIKPATVP